MTSFQENILNLKWDIERSEENVSKITKALLNNRHKNLFKNLSEDDSFTSAISDDSTHFYINIFPTENGGNTYLFKINKVKLNIELEQGCEDPL